MDPNTLPPKIKLLVAATLFQQGGSFKVHHDKYYRRLTPKVEISFPDRESWLFFVRTADPESDTDPEWKPQKGERFLLQVSGFHRCQTLLKPLLPYLFPTKAALIQKRINEYQEYLNNPSWRPPKPTPPFSTDNEDAL